MKNLYEFFQISRKSIFMVLLVQLIIHPALSGQSDWTAPKNADKLKNPVAGVTSATESGKKLYKQLCAICHGDKGKGDGIAGMALKPRPADLTSAKVQNQSDGAIYWKITEGKPPMASYKETLTPEERWKLVNFIRTLKK